MTASKCKKALAFEIIKDNHCRNYRCKKGHLLQWERITASTRVALHSEVDVDGSVAEWTNGLSLCLQIIRLINVFTPQKSLEEFQDL